MSYPNNHPPQGLPPYAPQGQQPYQNSNRYQGSFSPSIYQFTTEEKQVLKECHQESFYQRCVPFMSVLGFGAYYGVHHGYLKRNAAYGAVPKVMAGILIGYIAGKLSYASKCNEKILRLPGGRLKQAILTTRNFGSGSRGDNSSSVNDASPYYSLPSYASVPLPSNDQSTASELDSERHHDVFDDSFRIRPNTVDDSDDIQPLVPPSQSISYDELRARNRAEYESRRKYYRSGPANDYPPVGAYPTAPTNGYQVPPTNDHYNRTDSSQSLGATNNFIKMNKNQRPVEEFDSFSSTEQGFTSQQRVPIQRKNFYGDIIEK